MGELLRSTTLPVMQDVDGVLFDLDGTLWDTTAACAVGWNRVLLRYGIASREIVAEDVRRVAGKPHEACIRESFPELAESELQLLIDETPGEDIRMVAELGGALYPDVLLGLARLARLRPLFIVSNCQAGYIETFLRLNGLERTFRDFECWGNTRRPKADNLRDVIGRNGLAHPVFVGDTDGDQAAALACAVPFVHASYGYGRCEAPDFSASSFAQIADLVASAMA